MKNLNTIQLFFSYYKWLKHFLNDLPTPDFNLKIVFYEK
jgi:hypothetical protein